MDRTFIGVVQDAANNAGDILTTTSATDEFAHAVLEAYAQNYRHGDEAAAKAAAAVIYQLLCDESFERDCAMRDCADRTAHDRHMAEICNPLAAALGRL